jgi:GNAT superfamily N-acetyltransferase
MELQGLQFNVLPAGDNGTKYNRMLAEHGGRSIGHLDWHPGNNTIHSVYVDPEFQGQGIATHMARQVAENHMPTYPNGRRAQLNHSTNRTPAGERFAQATRDFTYAPPNQNAPRRKTRSRSIADDF